ncbi:hypothetical protein [Solidesulfovibrio sp.]
MATRSRLGRDPLQGTATPAAGEPAKAPRKAPPAGQSPRKTGGPRPKSRPAAAAPVETPAAAVPESPAPPAPEPLAVAPGPDRDRKPDSVPGRAAAETVQATAPLPDMPAPETGPTPAVATGGPTGLDGSLTVTAAPAALTGLGQAPAATQVAPAAETVPPAVIAPTARVQMPETATTTLAKEQTEHPVEVFLRGVLEGLLPEGEAGLCVEVDPETFSLPVEKLFYFSHALQRIATPLELPHGPPRRPDAPASPLPVLTVRLRASGNGRHVLTLTDNGYFFRSRLPGIGLGMEALRPLVAFIVKRHGSVRLAQGRCVAFEIIG